MRVPTLLPEPSVERLDESVIRGLPRTTEVQLHPVQVGPLVQAFRSALRAVIHPDGLGQPALLHAPEITPSAATVSTWVCSSSICVGVRGYGSPVRAIRPWLPNSCQVAVPSPSKSIFRAGY